MNKIFKSFLALVAGVVFFSAAAMAQVNTSIKLTITNSISETDSLFFGHKPGATYALDAGLGEAELPPLPPDDIFDVRWRSIPASHNVLGQGAEFNYHPFSGGSQLDTFRIGLQAGGAGSNYPVTISWPSLTTYFGNASLKFGTTTINMLTQTSVQITDVEVTQITLITDSPLAPPTGVQTAPCPLAFGIVPLVSGSASKTDSITITNVGGTVVTLDSVVSTDPQFIINTPPSFPRTLAAGAFVKVGITFSSVTGGAFSGQYRVYHSETGSPATCAMSATASSGEGLYFLNNLNQIRDHSSNNKVIVGVKYSNPSSMQGLQFKVNVPGSNLLFANVTFGPALPAAASNWTFDYEVNSATSGSEVEILLYGKDSTINFDAGTYDSLFVITYDAADVNLCDGALGGDTTTSYMYFSEVQSVLADGLGSSAGLAVDINRDSVQFNIHNSTGRGDVDCNDRVNILDITKTIQVVLDRSTFAQWQENRADLAAWSSYWATPGSFFNDANNYGDNILNVQDVVLMVSAVLNGNWPDGDGLSKAVVDGGSEGGSASIAQVYDVRFDINVYNDKVDVVMNNLVPVLGIQLELDAQNAPANLEAVLNEQFADRFNADVNVKNGLVRVLVYSLGGDVLTPADVKLLTLPFTASTLNVIEPIIAGDVNSNELRVEYSVNRVSAVAGEAVTGDAFAVQARPNPFSGTTTVRYALPKAGVVTVMVTDAQGATVARLVDGTQQAGEHTVSFDGANLPSGNYFCTVTVDGVSSTQKIVLNK